MSRWFLIVACLFVPFSTVVAERLPEANWPQWRGPHNTGGVDDGNYPSQLDPATNLIWKTKLPGAGFSTPIIWKQQIILTSPADGKDALFLLNWNGALQWTLTLGPERPGKHQNGSGSNPSPITDGNLIFAYYKSGTLAAANFDGQLLWQTNLQQRFSDDTLWWDLGTSPVVTKNAVIIAVMQEADAYLAAFEKRSGKLLWKVPRTYETPVEGDHSYATPIVITQDGKELIVVWGAEHLTAHDAANGKIIWSCGGFNPDENRNWVVVASHAIAEGIAVVPYGRGAHIAGIRLGKTGDITRTHRLWTSDGTGAFVPTPAISGGKIYSVRDEGEVECLDLQTGKTLWSNRFPKHRKKYYASPIVAGGKLFAPREDGTVLVASIHDGLTLLSENVLGEQIIASPVAVSNRLFIRGAEHLYCFAENGD